MDKIKEFFKTKTGQQIYSFAKTYITVFLGIYITLQSIMNEPSIKVMMELDLLDINILTLSAKGAFIAVVRNVYKILTEK